MWHSIQENLKKINSQLTVFSIVSLAITAFMFVLLGFYLGVQHSRSKEPVTFTTTESSNHPDPRPFGAANSPVYTYSWCQGADRIKASNKVYFRDADEAERQGRTLSKLCDR